MLPPNQGAAANGLSAVRSSVAGVRERTVRPTVAPEAVRDAMLSFLDAPRPVTDRQGR